MSTDIFHFLQLMTQSLMIADLQIISQLLIKFKTLLLSMHRLGVHHHKGQIENVEEEGKMGFVSSRMMAKYNNS